MSTRYKKVVVVGLGLIGSSIARALIERGLVKTLVAVDVNELSLEYGKKHGFVDVALTAPSEMISDAEIIILATPPQFLEEACIAISPFLREGQLVMDCCSVKQFAADVMQTHLPSFCTLIPAHPIAGSEQTGAAAGRADLLEKKRVIITPQKPPAHEVLAAVNEFWQALGARVEAMPPVLHDTLYGYVSHLPQLLIFAVKPLVDADKKDIESSSVLRLFMRISSSDKILWGGIFLLNSEVLLAALGRYIDVITHLRHELLNAPEDAPEQLTDDKVARLSLLPRIVASCLITTVMEAEKNAGIGFVRFAGSGFADVTSPAMSDPEPDMENISQHHKAVCIMLGKLQERLTAIHAALAAQDANALLKAIE